MKKRLASILLTAAAAAVIAVGMLVPKALLQYEETRYEQDRYAAERIAFDALPMTTPVNDLTGPLYIQWLKAARELLKNESSLIPRDPTASELTMEEAVITARSGLNDLIEYGAMPDIGLDQYGFKQGALKGYDASYAESAEMNSRPVGLWFMSFEDGKGHGINVVCDSRNGSVYSVEYDWIASFIEEQTCAMLTGFANSLGLQDGNGFYFEARDGFGFLYISEFCLFVDTRLPHSIGLWTGAAVYPTPFPTPTPDITAPPQFAPEPSTAPPQFIPAASPTPAP